MSKNDADALKREIDATERANKRGRDELHTEFNERAKAERNRIRQDDQGHRRSNTRAPRATTSS